MLHYVYESQKFKFIYHVACNRVKISMAKTTHSSANSSAKLDVQKKGDQIWSHIRKKWLVETPEERVRQKYLCDLVNEYGFTLDQMDEEVRAF